MARDFSYGALTGKATAQRAAAPVIATAPEAAAANTNTDAGAAGLGSMLDLRHSPAPWYVILVLVTAGLAKSLGAVRAR